MSGMDGLEQEFEKGDNFLATKRISSPPQLEDFDTLPPDDLSDLKTCTVGKCDKYQCVGRESWRRRGAARQYRRPVY